MAAGFPLVARPMLYEMGVGPAISVLGAVASGYDRCAVSVYEIWL